MLWLTDRWDNVEWQKHVALLDAGALIGPSDYALPLDVRIAARKAWEVRMSFCPLAVTSVSGLRFTLDAPMDVFHHAGIKGKDIRLANDREFSGAFVTDDNDDIVFVYADWYDGCGELLPPGSY